MSNQAQLLPGTLDLLILKAVSLGPLHGYGVLLRIGQISGSALLIEQGALYPGLVPPGSSGAAQSQLGHIGKQSPRQVLRAYRLSAASACAKKLKAGTASPQPWLPRSLPQPEEI